MSFVAPTQDSLVPPTRLVGSETELAWQVSPEVEPEHAIARDRLTPRMAAWFIVPTSIGLWWLIVIALRAITG